MISDSKEAKYIELIIKPIPPDTVNSVKAQIRSSIEEVLRESGYERLLAAGEFQFEVEKTVPTDVIIKAGFTLLTGIAVEVFKAVVVPRLKKHFEVKEGEARDEEGEEWTDPTR